MMNEVWPKDIYLVNNILKSYPNEWSILLESVCSKCSYIYICLKGFYRLVTA